MAKKLSLATAIEANRLSSDVPFLCLIDLEIVDPVTGVVVIVKHIANNTEDVQFGENTYAAGAFDITVKEEAGRPADVQLSVVDFSQAIQFYMEEYGGGVGSNVTLYIVNAARVAGVVGGQDYASQDYFGEDYAGALTQPSSAELVEYFQIVSSSSGEYRHSFSLGAENVLMQTFPRRRQTKNFCQWRYRSTECAYAGPMPSCDLTLQGANGCAAHNNTLNFGAYPGMNSNGYRYG